MKVLEYDGGFLHSKLWVIDDMLASCGSTNIDFRSFENNFEANVFFYDSGTADSFRRVFECDQLLCTPYEVDDRRNRFFMRLWLSLVRLLSPVM